MEDNTKMYRIFGAYVVCWMCWMELNNCQFEVITSYLPQKELLLIISIAYMIALTTGIYTKSNPSLENEETNLKLLQSVVIVIVQNIPLVYFCLGSQTISQLLLFTVSCHIANFVISYAVAEKSANMGESDKTDLNGIGAGAVNGPKLFSNKPVDVLHHFFLYQLTTCIINKNSIIPLLIFHVSMVLMTLLKIWMKQYSLYQKNIDRNNEKLVAVINGENSNVYVQLGKEAFCNFSEAPKGEKTEPLTEDILDSNFWRKFYIPHFNYGILGLKTSESHDEIDKIQNITNHGIKAMFEEMIKYTNVESRIEFKLFDGKALRYIALFYLPNIIIYSLFNVKFSLQYY